MHKRKVALSSSNCTACSTVAEHTLLLKQAKHVLNNIDKPIFESIIQIIDGSDNTKKYTTLQLKWDYFRTFPLTVQKTLATLQWCSQMANSSSIPIIAHAIVMDNLEFTLCYRLALFLYNMKHSLIKFPSIEPIKIIAFRGDCCVCQAQFANWVSSVCGHAGVCNSCFTNTNFKVTSCPLCREVGYSNIWRSLKIPIYNSEGNKSHIVAFALLKYLQTLADMGLLFLNFELTKITNAYEDINKTLTLVNNTFPLETDMKTLCLFLCNKLKLTLPTFNESTIERVHFSCERCKKKEVTHFTNFKQVCESCATKQFIKIQWA